jgi:hypothetical protein
LFNNTGFKIWCLAKAERNLELSLIMPKIIRLILIEQFIYPKASKRIVNQYSSKDI